MLNIKKLILKILFNFKYADFYGAPTGSTLPDKSVSSGTSWKNLGSITLPKGVWFISACVAFPSNAAGRRAMSLSTTSGSGGATLATETKGAVNGTSTYLQCRITQYFDGSTPLYVLGLQNSGSTLTASIRWSAYKLGEEVRRIDI